MQLFKIVVSALFVGGLLTTVSCKPAETAEVAPARQPSTNQESTNQESNGQNTNSSTAETAIISCANCSNQVVLNQPTVWNFSAKTSSTGKSIPAISIKGDPASPSTQINGSTVTITTRSATELSGGVQVTATYEGKTYTDTFKWTAAPAPVSTMGTLQQQITDATKLISTGKTLIQAIIDAVQ